MVDRAVVKTMANQQINISNSIEQFYMNRDNYNFEIEFQRGVVWTNLQKSELIISLLIGMYIPPLVVNKVDNEMRFVDGKQRATTILSYINNEYPLAEEIKDIEINYMDGTSKVYDLRGKKFNELPLELNNHLRTRVIDMRQFDNLSNEQEAMVIRLLNNGSAMNGIAKARLNSYDTILPFVVKLKENDFFRRKVNIAKSHKEKFKLDEKVIYNLIAYECNIEISDNIEYIVSKIKESKLFNEKVRGQISEVVEYLNRAFPTQSKILNTINIIPIYAIVKEYVDTIDERNFYNMLANIFNEDNRLKEVKGEWNSNKAIIERIDILKEICVDKLRENEYNKMEVI